MSWSGIVVDGSDTAILTARRHFSRFRGGNVNLLEIGAPALACPSLHWPPLSHQLPQRPVFLVVCLCMLCAQHAQQTTLSATGSMLLCACDAMRGPAVGSGEPLRQIMHGQLTKSGPGTAGVQSGGSIGMWQQYFGDGLHYYGVDINYLCAELFDGLPGETTN